MKIKITMRCNLTLVRMIIVAHTHTHITGIGRHWDTLPYWWDCKIVQLLWKEYAVSFKN